MNRTRILQIALICALIFALIFAPTAPARGAAALPVVSANALADGQFVFGPNVGDFEVRAYLQQNAPHLLPFATLIYEKAEYYSINPRVLLTLLEMRSGLLSRADAARLADPFGQGGGWEAQLDRLGQAMDAAFYARRAAAGESGSAGSVALAAGLQASGAAQSAETLDAASAQGFAHTYRRLFPGSDPLDNSNNIDPAAAGAVPPAGLLQLPFARGLSWKFGGVHETSGGGGVGTPFNDASSMDFYPQGSAWDMDTSAMTVVSAAGGKPTRISACWVKVVHSGGWETQYYHLEGVPASFGASINQNDKIGVIANTLAEATCSGGWASGPHVHFTLKYNGALYAINGAALSGWVVHAGRWNYDTDPNYMWIERGGVKKLPFNNTVLSEASASIPVVSSVVKSATSPDLSSVTYTVTFSEAVSGVDAADFAVTASGLSGTSVSAVGGSGAVYTVTVGTGSGDGALRLDVLDDDSILSLLGQQLGGPGAGNGAFSTGEVTLVGRTPGRVVLAGSAGVSGSALNYTDVTAKSVSAAAGGFYALSLPAGWAGTVTPVRFGYTFTPASRNYAGAPLGANLGGQDFAAVFSGTASFSDVPVSYWAWEQVEVLYKNGITGGCANTPLRYCPSYPVTRDQMAIFLLRVMHGSAYTPPAATGVFADVPLTHWAANWIEQLAAEGITSGCGSAPLRYCPSDTVTRDQMAVFLLRARHGAAYTPPAATGVFADVPTDYWAAAWIEQLAAEGVTSGCGSAPLRFCPAGAVTRDQMAVFLVRSAGLK